MVEPKDWLHLIHTPGLSTGQIHQLLEHFPDAGAVLKAPDSALRAAGLTSAQLGSLKSPDESAIAQDLAWLDRPDNHLLTLADSDYPHLLRQTARAPVVLFVTGAPSSLWLPQIAIVGSRNPTTGGLRNAGEFAAALAGSGFAITSGMAMGIDEKAHRSALDAGQPTIAVAGTGLDQVYPARHRDLAYEIAQSGGALVSEFPTGTPPRPANFPQRNRIISGLSLATLVVEGGKRSGSLITARMATEQGREVFAIPGSIHNPLARGCHQLIRQGATLVDDCTEMAEAVRPLVSELTNELRIAVSDSPEGENTASATAKAAAEPSDLDDDYLMLLEALGYDPMSIDTIVENTQLTPESVSSMLLILELDGHVQACPGSRYCRI